MSSFLKAKKLILTLTLTVFLGTLFAPTAHAGFWKDAGEALFGGGDEGISLTEYTGELAQIQTEGFDPTLVASTDLREFIIKIVNFALGFLALLAVIIIIYGGVLYVASGGEEERTTSGKKAIMYATIGLVIVMGSFAFVNTVIEGGTGGTEGGGGLGGTGSFYSGGFNASAEEVRALAVDIINGYTFLAESTEEMKNMQNDTEKESLLPDNLPSKGSVLTYLNSVKIKMQNIQNKISPFSVSHARINDIVRVLDKDIDQINGLNTKAYFKNNFSNGKDASNCDDKPDEPGDFIDGAQGDSYKKFCKDNDYDIEYIEGLYPAWHSMHKEYSAQEAYKDKQGNDVLKGGTLYAGVLKPLSDDFALELKRIFRKLDDINDKFQNIDAIKQGQAASAYALMKGTLAYGYKVTVTATGSSAGPGFSTESKAIDKESAGFLADIEAWSLDANIDVTGQFLIAGLEQQANIYEALKNLKFVRAILSADVIEGSAPLTVLFDTVGSVDPAGGSIDGKNIVWDIGGALTLDALYKKDENSKTIVDHDDVKCEGTIIEGGDDADLIGNTALRCEFTKPGTYTTAVKIRSNQQTKFAEGVSILTIKVLPRTTKIELTITPSGENSITIMHYDNELLLVDKPTVRVNVSSADAGIDFNACDSKATNYKWDFGNGDSTDFTTSCSELEYKGYKDPGKYSVTLEVMNALGVVDKKTFTLEIASIAARLKARPANGSFVNTPVTFDASASKSDLGKINNYEWTIYKSAQQDIQVIDLETLEKIDAIYPPGDGFQESGASLKTITHEFKYGLNYDITVKVTDDAGESDTSTIENYRVESQPPKAFFNFEIPNPSQPGTVHFDGSKSFDPDGDKNFSYEWTIEPEGNDVWELYNDEQSLTSSKPIVAFLKKGDYDVTLKVTDNLRDQELDEKVQTVVIDNVLDVSWDPEQEVTNTLDKEGKATINFQLVNESGTAAAYEIDFGDGETEQGAFPAAISHDYTESGKFNAKVTLYDEDDNGNTATRRIFVGGGENPVARIRLLVNNDEVNDLTKTVVISKKDILTFDASDSKNTDGTGRDLKYSWNFGDTKTSSKKSATHTYKVLSPIDPGHFQITLKVVDKDDATKFGEDEVQISVINMPPTFSSVQGIPLSDSADLITPVNVQLKAYGAEDEDGEIVSYRWWYFDVDDPEEQLGVTVTQAGNTSVQIGTNGKEGFEREYGFGLEVTDSDGQKYSNEEEISDGQFTSIEVVNGKNAAPTSKFNVDTTSVFVGDKVNFTSSSSDPDGNIISYIWDLEGDGFFNNEPTEESSVEHVFDAKNKNGYAVRLKVIDDKGGEAVSEPIKVYVDSLADQPTAAFKYEVVAGSDGMKVNFINNSKADEDAGAKLISHKWDFDTNSLFENSDSDGDGLKDNDVDSQAKNPSRLYTELGSYSVKLTITDDQGNSDDVTNTVTIPLANPPVAAFTYQVVDGKVSFTNNSSADAANGALIEGYVWDFDTGSELAGADSDGDGQKDNDNDSNEKDPVSAFELAGKYLVKLTVKDNQGNEDSVTNEVNATSGIGSPDGPFLPGDGDGDMGSDGSSLIAFMTSIPVPGADNIVYLPGESGTVKFDFTKSEGAISYYTIDKNIYFDTNGNGVKNDDQDFKTVLPGTWTTNFKKEWGKIVVKLIVGDIYGNEASVNIEIKFN